MKNLPIIITFFLIGSLALHAQNTPVSEQSVILNQRLELISKVNCLSDKLDELKADHLDKMNKYAELIEEKETRLKKTQKEYWEKTGELKLQNRKDRQVFNNELENQRVCSRDEQLKYSENLQKINSEYLDEISELKTKYEDIIKESATDYQNKLSKQQIQYVDDLTEIKDDFGSQIEHLNTELTDLRSTDKTLILELQKRLNNIEKNEKSNVEKSIVANKSNLKSLGDSVQPIVQKKNSYLYRLFN